MTEECKLWPIAPLRRAGEPEAEWNRRFWGWRMGLLVNPDYAWMLSDKPTAIVVGYDEFGKPTGATRAIKEP